MTPSPERAARQQDRTHRAADVRQRGTCTASSSHGRSGKKQTHTSVKSCSAPPAQLRPFPQHRETYFKSPFETCCSWQTSIPTKYSTGGHRVATKSHSLLTQRLSPSNSTHSPQFKLPLLSGHITAISLITHEDATSPSHLFHHFPKGGLYIILVRNVLHVFQRKGLSGERRNMVKTEGDTDPKPSMSEDRREPRAIVLLTGREKQARGKQEKEVREIKQGKRGVV